MTLGGCDLGVVKTVLEEKHKISKDWAGMRAKLGTACVTYRVFFLSAHVYILGLEGMDVKLSNLNVNLNPAA